MRSAVIFDCEFLASENSQKRFWCCPYDPDPVIVQIGAVKIDLEKIDLPVLDTLKLYIQPQNRNNTKQTLDPFFTKLTGVTQRQIDEEGIPLSSALEQMNQFSEGGMFWSWGKDEMNMMAISCYVAGINPIIPVQRFENITKFFLKSGMPYEDLLNTRSSGLASYYGIDTSALKAHDALDDTLSIVYALQHLCHTGKADPAWLSNLIAEDI
jgi:inhibitor of KinA sporulation pathway (predicted exonuclease)